MLPVACGLADVVETLLFRNTLRGLLDDATAEQLASQATFTAFMTFVKSTFLLLAAFALCMAVFWRPARPQPPRPGEFGAPTL